MNHFALNLQEQYQLAQARGSFQRLLWLDDIWTSFLADKDRISADESESLQSLTNEMRELLAECARHAQWFATISQRKDFEEMMAGALDKIGLPTNAKPAVVAKIKAPGAFAAFIRDGIRYMSGHSSEESDLIAEKMRSIRDGKFVRGDLSGRCALLAVVIGLAAGGGEWAFAVYAFGESVEAGCWG